MQNRAFFDKLIWSLRKRGFLGTASKVAKYPFKARRMERNLRDLFDLPTPEERFTRIFAKGLWGNDESASGPGSSVEYTEDIRQGLLNLIRQFDIHSIFDAPCGDFNWMNLVIAESRIAYIGGDIVKPLIQRNTAKYANTQFMHVDITKDHFPAADLWFCRDCLFHLSFEDTFRALRLFVVSDFPYIFTTTYKNNDGFENADIVSGDWRLIDLFSEPYCLDQQVLFRVEERLPRHAPREMCLWSKDQVARAIERSERI